MTKRRTMRIAVIAAGFVFLSDFVLSEGRKTTVGVLPFWNLDAEGERTDAYTGVLTDVLSRYSFIRLVERADLEEAAKQIKYEMTGLVEGSAEAKLGHFQSTDILILGATRGRALTTRAVDTETGVILGAATGDASQLGEIAATLADDIETYGLKKKLKNLRNDSPDIDFDFSMWKERNQPVGRSLRLGNTVSFQFQSNIDGYLVLIDFQPGGDIVLLYPNKAHPDNHIEKNRLYMLPSDEDMFSFTVSQPIGRDTVVAFFSKRPVNWLDPALLQDGDFSVAKNSSKAKLTRGLTVTSLKLKNTDWESRVLDVDVTE